MPETTLAQFVERLLLETQVEVGRVWVGAIRQGAGKAWDEVTNRGLDLVQIIDIAQALEQQASVSACLRGDLIQLLQELGQLSMTYGIDVSREIGLILNPVACRFGCTRAVARFVMSEGCICYPHDRQQSLCIHHLGYSQPFGSMELVEILVPDPTMANYLEERFGFVLVSEDEAFEAAAE